jgi:transcriptional regulator with GAF, ATPase, and Fis domain
MATTSQAFAFDNRLLAVEESIRQRQYDASRKELKLLRDDDFAAEPWQLGLFFSLRADIAFHDGDYRTSLDQGLQAARLLADFPLNRRYGRALLVLSKTYSAIGDIRSAETKAYDGLASFRRAGDTVGQVDALNELARQALIRCELSKACQFLDDAIALVPDNPRKVAQLTGNASRIRVLRGEWQQAEEGLKAALKHNEDNHEDISRALNLLSLGYLHLRRREHVFAERCLASASETIDRQNLKREKTIYLEYMGELAYEKGDLYKAKALLVEAYQFGRLLAPESSLVSQAGRRLAEVELALDNMDEAMALAQKALGLAIQIGEITEAALARRVIAQVFAERSEFADAVEHITLAVEAARAVGDPVDLARTLLVMADILVRAGSDEVDRIRNVYDEALRIFRRLKLDFWVAETEYRSGVFACQQGRLSRGFKKLNRSERMFASLSEAARARRVNQFLTSLADQAVALSVSDENEFKLFGRLVNQDELDELRAGQMDELLDVLKRRTGASRTLIVASGHDGAELVAIPEMNQRAAKHFVDDFRRLLGEEIATDRPTLRLDCRRDPYINELFPDVPDMVASVMVVPFHVGDGDTSYLYLDKLSIDNTLNPFSQDALNFAVGMSDIVAFKYAELQRAKLLEDNRRLKEQLRERAAFPNIVTRSDKMLELLAQVRQVVDSNISVAIEGPTGSGKDLLARAIHYNSGRRDKRFISINCAALPETLLESELFGYRRGAFTGADRDKPGLLEEADGGTFFLDEIADMPLSIQAKILRVLEDKEIVRLGDSTPRRVDVRIISATNKDLKDEMADKRFRQDLYYRLSALTFRLPALAERREDIPLLLGHFLNGSNKRLSPEVLKSLVNYDWPGNVRELENEIKKLILLAGDAEEIGVDLLSSKMLSAVDRGVTADVLRSVPDEIVFNDRYSLYDYLAQHERRFIVKALKERGGIKKHAAKLLNIPESTLRLKIKEYDIDLNQLDSVH